MEKLENYPNLLLSEPSLNFTETFKLHLQGPNLTVGDGYFVCSKGQTSQFERHVGTVIFQGERCS